MSDFTHDLIPEMLAYNSGVQSILHIWIIICERQIFIVLNNRKHLNSYKIHIDTTMAHQGISTIRLLRLYEINVYNSYQVKSSVGRMMYQKLVALLQ